MTTTDTIQQQAIDLLTEAGTDYRIQANGSFLIGGHAYADYWVVRLWGLDFGDVTDIYDHD